MSLGRQDKVAFPETYRDFRLIRTHGRVFGVPPTVDPDGRRGIEELFTHPAAISAATLDDLRELIDRCDREQLRPRVVGSCADYNLVRYRGSIHGVPRSAEAVDLDLAESRQRAGVITGSGPAAVEEMIREAAAADPVEFAGWLPIYTFSGNCGSHPQFTHTGKPPPGHRFTGAGSTGPIAAAPRVGPIRHLISKVGRGVRNAGAMLRVPLAFFRPHRGVSLRARVRVFAAVVRLVVLLLSRNCRIWPILRFLQSRHLHSQLLIGDQRKLVFLTSMPYTYGQNPWVIEIEDPTTLFYPLVQNGHTCGMSLAESPYFPIVKALLEADHCKAILTHMQSTAAMVSKLFASAAISAKIVYAPLGVNLPARWQRHDLEPADEPIHLLFINSWCQVPENFFVRGGLDVLEAFDVLRVRYPQLRLTMRSSLPALADHYHRIMETGWVRTVNRFLPADELVELHAASHIFLLPAARVHIVSLLQAMSYGLAVVASDGWGMEEYLTHERNGLIVRGRYGKASWADHEAGMLRENYDHTHTADPEVVAGIVEAVSRLVEDRALRRRLGRAAREEVRTKFNVDGWNRGLKEALDRARPEGAGSEAAGCARSVINLS